MENEDAGKRYQQTQEQGQTIYQGQEKEKMQEKILQESGAEVEIWQGQEREKMKQMN